MLCMSPGLASVIITLGNKLYMILEVAPTYHHLFDLLLKQCNKIIPKTRKFVFFLISLKVRGRLWPHPCSPGRVPPQTEADG
jgi:hypothetical protein